MLAGPERQTGDVFAVQPPTQSVAVDATSPSRLPIAPLRRGRRARRAPAASPRPPSRRPTTSSSSTATRRSRSRAASASACSTSTASCASRATRRSPRTDVFIGPDAQLQTCFDADRNGNDCTTAARSRSRPSGGVAISPAIDLRGAVGTNRAGGSLAIRAGRVSLGGGVETAGTIAPSGGIIDRLAGPRRHAEPARARRRHHGARRRAAS